MVFQILYGIRERVLGARFSTAIRVRPDFSSARFQIEISIWKFTDFKKNIYKQNMIHYTK